MLKEIIHLLEHTLKDSITLIPFLLIAFLIIELIEHKFSNKAKNVVTNSGKFGPLLGGILGAVPQCGFSVIATNLYVTRIVSLGTLIAIYLSTSDEMIPILLSHNVNGIEIIKIVGLKVIIGIIFGFIIDFIYRKKINGDFHLCEEDDCDCDESIIKSAVVHTLKTLIFILIITFGLNILFEYFNLDIVKKFISDNIILSPILSSLIGLIPNCGSSIMITELYINGIIPFGACMSGLLTGSGISLIILFKTNKKIKENLSILGIIFILGVVSGIIINIIGSIL